MHTKVISSFDREYFPFEIPAQDLSFFLTQWSGEYNDPKSKDTDFYDPYIGKPHLLTDEKAILSLFKWKNGMELSKRKEISVKKNYLEHWIDDICLEARYLDPEKPGGPIWNIFYLHCRLPHKYPIFDQHACRAMTYVKDGRIWDQPTYVRRADVYAAYCQEYIPFVDKCLAAYDKELSNIDRARYIRKVDRALYTFGHFLKNEYRREKTCRLIS